MKTQFVARQGDVLLFKVAELPKGAKDVTPEPDGSIKPYFLSVNPNHYAGAAGKIPHAAIASTWRKKPDGAELFFRDYREYQLSVQT